MFMKNLEICELHIMFHRMFLNLWFDSVMGQEERGTSPSDMCDDMRSTHLNKEVRKQQKS